VYEDVKVVMAVGLAAKENGLLCVDCDEIQASIKMTGAAE
jgi:hypothetical protein